MAPNVTVSFWDPTDINGTPIHTITSEDPNFKGLTLKLDLNGLGGWELTLSRRWGYDLFNDGAARPEVFVRFLIPAYSATDWYWGGTLSKRQQDVVHRDETGAEEFVLGGPGPKQYLERYAMGITESSPGAGYISLQDGVWRWDETATAGRILSRLITDDADASNPAMPDLTKSFGPVNDSDGIPWANTVATDGTFDLPIGNSLLQSIWDLEDLGDLYTTVNLGTVASPLYELEAWQTFGDDVADSSFGAGVGLLREGVNIANDSLTVTGVAFRKATHVIVEGKDGVWDEAHLAAWDPGDYVKWAKIEYPRSSNENVLHAAGLRWLRRQENGDKQLDVEILPGADDAAGYYFPSPTSPIWLGNTVALDTIADGSIHSPMDYNNSPQLVTALELSLGPAGSDASADAHAKSWDIKVKLNTERGGNGGAPNQSSATGSCDCHPGSSHPRPPVPGTVTTATGEGAANNDGDQGVTVASGQGQLIAVLVTGAGVSPGTVIYSTASSGGTDSPMTLIGQITHPVTGASHFGNRLLIYRLANPDASGVGAAIEWGTAGGSQFGTLKGYWTSPSTATPTVITASGTSATASVTPTGAGAADMVLMCAGNRTHSFGDGSSLPSDLSSQTDDWVVQFNNSAGQYDATWFGGHLAGAGVREVNMGYSKPWVAAAIILGGVGATAGSETEPVGPTGSGTPGSSTVYSPIDHVHEHGLLSPDTLHYHDVAQVEGASELVSETAVKEVGHWEPVTDGDVDATELVFEEGDVVMEWVAG